MDRLVAAVCREEILVVPLSAVLRQALIMSQRLRMPDHAGSSRTAEIYRPGSSDFIPGNSLGSVRQFRPSKSLHIQIDIA